MRRGRRGSDADEPVVRERVARLLGGSQGGGWVPVPEPVTGPAAAGLEQDLLGAAVEDLDRSWSPRADDPDDEPHRPPALSPPVLPDTVRGGRLDPGRTGALALLLVCVVAALVATAVVVRGRPQAVPLPELQQAGEPLPGVTPLPTQPAELVVSVAGNVASPGLVRLPPGSRVDDAVRAAGGLAPGADPGLLNLARALVDGEQVLVGIEPPPGSAPAEGRPGALLDLNVATAADLQDLPGIGPVLAERIVGWRTEHGRFRSVDQLREVPGIGEAKFSALRSKVTV